MSLILDEHRQYLSDRTRVKAFRSALREVIHPGDTVLDMGAGTGILGLLACEAGARHVYSIDEGSIAELARAIYRANGFGDRVTVMRGLSTRLQLPARADIVVADQIGRFGFDAGVLEFFHDAGKRLLKPAARAIPSKIEMWIALVERPEQARNVSFWKGRPAGLSFAPAVEIAENTGYPVDLMPRDLLSEAHLGASLDTLAHGRARIAISATLAVTRAGTLHGIGGWFAARLSPRVTMTNSPLASHRIGRRNVFFPIASPAKVRRGDEVEIAFNILPHEFMVSWSVAIAQRGAKRARFRHSTLKGMLISREDLLRTDPGFVPALTPWGMARKTVLELCDGKRALGGIEGEVFHRHRELFPSLADAAAFTAEVVTRYAK